jgi:hypothetical protein
MSGPQSAFEEGLASHGGIFRVVPGLGEVMGRFSDFLFKEYIPKVAMRTWMVVNERNTERYAGKLSQEHIDELSSRQVNAASGYQNYRLLGRSKLMIDVGRLVMVAPQFLTSEAKVIGQALKPYGAEQRRMLLIQGLTIYVGARILNQLLDGDPHLEAANMFSVVYHGRAYGMRAIVPDLAHALSRDGFWAGRLGPLPKAGIEAFTGRDMRTGARINSYIQWAPGRMAEIFAGNLVKWLVPGGAEGFLPGAAGREQNSLSTLLMSTAGVTSHKYTAQTQVSGWAADFNRNSGDPSARTHQRQLDTEAHVESAYRKLDALLDENKIDQADAEYSELVKDGHKPGNIAERYSHVMRPFTGQGAREGAFRDSLSAGQREIYQRALDERRARLGAFQRMIAKDAETRRHGDTERN